MTRKKTVDPRRVALTDKLNKARVGFERWYLRLKRALTAMEKCRRQAQRLACRLDKLDEENHS